jgi:hypothetical protein
MKNAIITGTIAATILIAGCGKKSPSSSVTPKSANADATSSSPITQLPEASAQFILRAGDIASPVEVTTNHVGGTNRYSIFVKFSSEQQVRFRQFQEEHQNQNIEILGGSKRFLELQHIKGVQSPVAFTFPYPSLADAQAMADALNNMGEK